MNGEAVGDPDRNSDPQNIERENPGLVSRLLGMFGLRGPLRSGAAPELEALEATNGEDAQAQDRRRDARRSMIERVIAFDQKRVADVMAPRADIYAVDVDTLFDELVEKFAQAGHSRMPVYRGDLDDPIGMIHIKDVIGLVAQNAVAPAEPVLAGLRREILYAPPSMLVTELLLRMQASRIHMALVIDEFGGTDGLVTIEDLIEEIVGEINDEHDDDDEPAIINVPGGCWDIDARVEIEEFTEIVGVQLPLADEEEIDTIGGYVVALAGRVPQRGEVIADANGFDIEVVEADARRLRKVRLRPVDTSVGEAAQ